MILNCSGHLDILSSFKIYFIIIFSLLIVIGIVVNVTNSLITTTDIQFEEVTEFAGISYYGISRGSSWGDFNGDGWPDIWTGNHGSHGGGSVLYLNNADGTFNAVKENLGFENVSNHDIHGATWMDFDNDGDQGLMVMSGAAMGQGQDSNFVFVNNGSFFKSEAETLGLDEPLGRGRSSLWFDWNNDGLLDVVLNNYPRPDGQAPPTLFTQTKSGFEKVFAFDDVERTQAAQISRLFHDNSTNIIFLNPSPEGIYNLKKIPFENILSEINLRTLGSKDVVTADFNGDLTQDIFRSRGGWNTKAFQNDLLEFNDGEEFSFLKKSGFSEPTSCLGSVGGDFDNDMDVDIYMICSIWGKTSEAIDRQDKNLPNIVLVNQGNGNFMRLSEESGAEGSEMGNGETVSMADYDNDGFLDLFITNGGGWSGFAKGGPHQLFRNLGNDNNWIEIDLEGTTSNRDGVGTLVYVTTGDITQFREQTGGVHFRAQNHQRIHFGLGDNDYIDRILIKWPSGIVHSIENVSVNKILEITEPMTP